MRMSDEEIRRWKPFVSFESFNKKVVWQHKVTKHLKKRRAQKYPAYKALGEEYGSVNLFLSIINRINMEQVKNEN